MEESATSPWKTTMPPNDETSEKVSAMDASVDAVKGELSNLRGDLKDLRDQYQTLSIQITRLVTLAEARAMTDEDTKKRLAEAEKRLNQTENTLRVVQWVGGVLFTLTMFGVKDVVSALIRAAIH